MKLGCSLTRSFQFELHDGSQYLAPLNQLSLIDPRSLRHYIGIFREETLLGELKARLETIKAHGFDIVALEPYQKDGGVFVRFKYSAGDPSEALKSIEAQLRQEACKHGGLPSWNGLGRGNVWLVKGSPWKEVRFVTLV